MESSLSASFSLGTAARFASGAKNIKKFMDRVKEITRRSRGVSIQSRYRELRQYLNGWVGYFRLVPIKSFFMDLDKWLRRRIRACYWKQWRKPKTKASNLLRLGVAKDEAYSHGNSSKGPWLMSYSRAVHQARSVAYLAEDGLPSLFEIWTKFASKGRIA